MQILSRLEPAQIKFLAKARKPIFGGIFGMFLKLKIFLKNLTLSLCDP